jgi:hypothetical protein
LGVGEEVVESLGVLEVRARKPPPMIGATHCQSALDAGITLRNTKKSGTR